MKENLNEVTLAEMYQRDSVVISVENGVVYGTPEEENEEASYV